MVITDCIRDVFMRVDVAGINLIINRNRYLTATERIIFTALFLVLVGISISFLLSAWMSYQEHPTVHSFKGGKNTNCSTAALTICPTYGSVNPVRIAAYGRSTWGHLSKSRHQYYRRFLELVANASIFTMQGFGRYVFDPSLPDRYFGALQRKLNLWFIVYSAEAVTMFGQIKFNLGEGGLCLGYGFILRENLTDIRKIMPCFIHTSASFEIKPGYKFYIHSPYDMPEFGKPEIVPLFASRHYFAIKTIEELADPAIRKVSIQQRKCRFPDENILSMSPYYTNSMCRLQCRRDMIFKLCNCYPHFYLTDTAVPYCKAEGLACVGRYQQLLISMLNDRNICNCDNNCGGVTFERRVLSHEEYIFQSSVSNARALCTAKYERDAEMVVKHHLVYSSVDMLASWGGAVSLFLGISLLTLIELTYLGLRWPITQWRASKKLNVKLSTKYNIFSILFWQRKKSQKKNRVFKCLNSFTRGITNILKEWLDKTSFNVISYIGNMEMLIIERIFWFALFSTAIYGCSNSAWQMLKDNDPIIDELHISQVKMPYKFPTFTICGQIPYPGLQNLTVERYKKAWCLYDLMFISSAKSEITERIDVDDCLEVRLSVVNITREMYKYSMELEGFVASIELNGHNLSDWRAFQPIQTERGPCFSLNSEQTPPVPKDLKEVYQEVFKKKHEATSLEFRINNTRVPYQLLQRFTAKYMSIHSSIDILTGSDELSGTQSMLYESIWRMYRPQEIEPDPDISEWPPEIRGCRHPDEVLPNQFYPKYSYTACIASCRAQELLQKCGCVHPMNAAPGDWPICNLQQYYCIQREMKTIYLPAEWKNLNCGCVRSCSDTSFHEILQNHAYDKWGILSLKVIPGHEKIRLRLKTGKLDVFVMVGGMFSLFVGASMMSVVEVFMFFTARFLTNILRQFRK